jgi:hypothetical protein
MKEHFWEKWFCREGEKTILWLVPTAVCKCTRTSMGKEYNEVLQLFLDASYVATIFFPVLLVQF